MSYILEALKKSERQRPPGPVPDLFTVQGPLSGGGRELPRTSVVAGAAFALVVAFLLWAWLDERHPSEPALVGAGVPVSPAMPRPDAAARTPAAGAEPPAAARTSRGLAARRTSTSREESRAPSALAARSAASPSAAVPPPAPPATADTSGPVPNRPAPVPPPPAAEAAAVPSAPTGAAAAPVGLLPSGHAAPAVPAAAPASERAADAAGTTSGAALGLNAASAASLAEPPPPDDRLREFEELPAAVRAALPALALSGHVWSDEPALRLVSVGDRIVREGGEAAPGVRLEEITPTEAVFSFRGWRFRVPGL